MAEVPFRWMLGAVLVLPLGLGSCADAERVPHPIPDVGERRIEATGSVGAELAADAPAAPSTVAAGTPETAFRAPATIPAGTLVRVRLDQAISSRSHGSGDRVPATVSDEVLAEDGMVLVPEGARLFGTVQWPDDAPPAFRFERLLVDGGYLALEAVGASAGEPTAEVPRDSGGITTMPSGSIIVVEVMEAVPLTPR